MNIIVIFYSIISVLLVSAISLIGVLALSVKVELLKKFLLYTVSFSTGALFGSVFLHLLPEAAEQTGFSVKLAIYVLTGIVFFFITEKFIHWRHCHNPQHIDQKIHSFALMNLFGDSIHNFIDGLVIGATYLVSIPLGLVTTLAVILHEIPQEIGDFGVLLHGGFSKKRAILINFLTALTAVLGTIIALAIGSYTENLNNFLVPFAAGGFIYIAGSDLIPELHKESKIKNSIMQLLVLIAGIAVTGIMLFFPHNRGVVEDNNSQYLNIKTPSDVSLEY